MATLNTTALAKTRTKEQVVNDVVFYQAMLDHRSATTWFQTHSIGMIPPDFTNFPKDIVGYYPTNVFPELTKISLTYDIVLTMTIPDLLLYIAAKMKLPSVSHEVYDHPALAEVISPDKLQQRYWA